MPTHNWLRWARTTAELCLMTSKGWPAVFIQTDRRDGGWHSWPAIIHAANSGRPFIWHKIALTREPDRTDLHRPTYRHVIAAGDGTPGPRTPDVWHDGPKRWTNGVGATTADVVGRWIVERCPNMEILNPFAGSGTLIDAIIVAGGRAIGCDINPRWTEEDSGVVSQIGFTI